MALILLQPNQLPIGQYDAVDGYTTSILGGEVCSFTTVTVSSDAAAADAADGYLNPGTSRPALTVNLPVDGYGPFYLTDDGIKNYGTLFGTVVGGTVGQVSFGPNTSVPSADLLGPHTALGSGKWSAWQAPGLYGVTLDALDASVQPTSATPQPGLALYANNTLQAHPGRLTATSANGVTNGVSATVMARFVEFRTNGSLVTTPNRLVSALNSPSSTVGGVLSNAMFMGVINFFPEL